MTSEDANEYILTACKVNNVNLLIEALPHEGRMDLPNVKVDAAIIATKLDHVESLQVIGKYLKNHEWDEFNKRKDALGLDNRCVAWAEQESQFRVEDAQRYSKKSFIGKVIEFMTEDKVAALPNPGNEGPSSELLCKEHIAYLNTKLKPANAYIVTSQDEGPEYYKIYQSNPPVETGNGFVKTVAAIKNFTGKEVLMTAEVTEVMDFLTKNYSKELAAPPELNKEATQNNISALREQFLNKTKKSNDMTM